MSNQNLCAFFFYVTYQEVKSCVFSVSGTLVMSYYSKEELTLFSLVFSNCPLVHDEGR